MWLTMSLNVKGSIGTPVAGDSRTVETRILHEFSAQIGGMLVTEIQNYFGSAEIYQLSPAYAASKVRLTAYKPYPGKAPAQPLILTGAMHDAATWEQQGSETHVYIDLSKVPGATVIDYPELWEEKVQYLEHALALCEPKFVGILTAIIVKELGI